jgi:hypothetical protein
MRGSREDVSTQISASPRALRCSNLLQPARLRSSETTLKWQVHAAAYYFYYYYYCCCCLLMPRRNSFASHRVAGSADVDGPSYSGCTCFLGLLGLLHTMAIACAQKQPNDFSLAAMTA